MAARVWARAEIGSQWLLEPAIPSFWLASRRRTIQASAVCLKRQWPWTRCGLDDSVLIVWLSGWLAGWLAAGCLLAWPAEDW